MSIHHRHSHCVVIIIVIVFVFVFVVISNVIIIIIIMTAITITITIIAIAIAITIDIYATIIIIIIIISSSSSSSSSSSITMIIIYVLRDECRKKTHLSGSRVTIKEEGGASYTIGSSSVLAWREAMLGERDSRSCFVTLSDRTTRRYLRLEHHPTCATGSSPTASFTTFHIIFIIRQGERGIL